MVSDESDGDAGLLATLLGPPSFRLPHQAESSALSSSGAMDVAASRIQCGSLRPVPCWRLAWEGPFLSEILPSDTAGFGDGCAFRNTTYRSADYAQPSGKYGLPLHHPRFLEWIGAPESARLLDRGPSEWLHSLSREQAIDAAHQLHRDVCLMTTNLNVLSINMCCPRSWNSVSVPGNFRQRQWLRVPWAHGFCRASVHMEAMGLWRSSLVPATYP